MENEQEKNNFDMFISAMNRLSDLHIKLLKNELKQRPFSTILGQRICNN